MAKSGTTPKSETSMRPYSLYAATALLIFLVMAAETSAQTGGAVTAPRGRGKPTHGVTMTVDTTWVEGLGYRPIRVTIVPVKPTTFDRTFRVQISGQYTYQYDNIMATKEILLPSGSTALTPATEIITLPQHGSLLQYRVDVWEGGRRLRELTLAGTGLAAINAFYGATYPKVLVISDSPVDITAMKQILFANNQANQVQWTMPVNSAAAPTTLSGAISAVTAPTVHTVVTAGLTKKWIDYASIDIICLSLDEFDGLRKTQPEALQAIEDWTRAGGNLVVHGIGQQWKRWAEFEVALGPAARSDPSVDDPSERPGWTQPKTERFRKLRVGDYETSIDENGMPSEPFVYTPLGQFTGSGQLNQSAVDGGVAPVVILTRPWQTGLVVAVDGDLLPSSSRNWLHVFSAIEPARRNWNDRHGVSFHGDNTGFWRFLIAGVGKVPVTMFRFLITVFVIGIGPAQYFLLRRRNRLHLTVITIPLSAIVVTGALLTYAILADGLGTRVRARSYTQIDQRTGEMVCWGRASYYAGLAPSGGLTFSQDTAVYPYEAFPEMNSRSTGRLRSVRWDSQQRLTGGWLLARTPTQLLTIRSSRTNRGVAVAPPVEGKDGLTITNRLGTSIGRIWLRDFSGNFYTGGATQDEKSADLRPISIEELQADFKNIFRPMAAIKAPTGIGLGGSRRGMWGYNYYGWMGQQYSSHDAKDSTSRLEQGIKQISLAVERGDLPLGKRSYVAVVTHSPEMELGLEPDETSDSFQVVVGKW